MPTNRCILRRVFYNLTCSVKHETLRVKGHGGEALRHSFDKLFRNPHPKHKDLHACHILKAYLKKNLGHKLAYSWYGSLHNVLRLT